jgi:hypothetical protein
MSEPPRVSSDRVLEIIRQDAVGAYLLRAAIAEATCEAYQQRVDELERSSGVDDATEPAHALRPSEPAQF